MASLVSLHVGTSAEVLWLAATRCPEGTVIDAGAPRGEFVPADGSRPK
jgi:hypothetical protein